MKQKKLWFKHIFVCIFCFIFGLGITFVIFVMGLCAEYLGEKITNAAEKLNSLKYFSWLRDVNTYHYDQWHHGFHVARARYKRRQEMQNGKT